jgi:stage II sporulation protein D
MSTRKIAAAGIATLALSLAGGSVAGATDTFRYIGSGYGHGIGMSQYGALGLARQGWAAGRIVRHYYRGARVVERASRGTIRVGLLQDEGEVVVNAVGGQIRLTLEGGSVIDTVSSGSRRTIRITEDRRYRIIKPGGAIVGGRSWGGPRNDLVIRRAGGRIHVGDWGHEIAHGSVAFDIVGSGRAHVVGEMTLESYVLGVSEMSASWPENALRAQAIASRTYAAWRLAGGGASGCSCDIQGSTADQNFVGWTAESGDGRPWARAVEDTRRRILVYGGKAIYAVYGSSSGGYTESIWKVWPAAQKLPYLSAVCDPYDDVSENANVTWRESFSATEVTDALRPYTGDIGRVRSFRRFDRGASGRVSRVRVVGADGSATVQGWDVRTALGLRDTRFSVNQNLNITGRIRGLYDREDCKPGRASSPQKRIRGGRWQGFQRGRVYVNDRRDAVSWIRGRVLSRYLAVGGHGGRLRLPYRYDQVPGGTKGWFDGGTVTCAPTCRVAYR